MLNKKERQNLYRSEFREAVRLYRSAQGVLLLFIIIFSLLQDFLINLGTKIWGMVLATAPSQYISDGNIKDLLKCPQIILVGFILLLGYSLLSAWKLSGIMLCLEYHYQKKAIRFLKLIPLAARNIRHLLKSKNWPFFFWILVVLPFVELYKVSGIGSQLFVPEYIMLFIESHTVLFILFVLLAVGLFYLNLKWFYVLQGVLIKRQNFREAHRESAAMMKGKKLFQLISLVRFTVCQVLYLYVLPAIPLAIMVILSISLEYGQPCWAAAIDIYYKKYLLTLFIAVTQCYIEMAVMCYLVISYHKYLTVSGLWDYIPLQESAIKRKGHIFSFRYLRFALYLLIGTTSLIFFCMTANAQPGTKQYEQLNALVQNDSLIYAHKGYTAEAPENTMDAFQLACACGKADGIELDIRESKDGIPIVIHNASLKDATGVDIEVYDMDYEEIRKLNAHYNFTEEEFPNAYVPTLEEVLAAYADKIPLLIEIKADPRTPDLPDKIVTLMQKYNCTDTCAIHSGSYESLERVKEIDPDIKCGLILAIAAGSYSSLPCADFFSVEHNFVSDNLVEILHNSDKKIAAWTVNDTSSIKDIKGRDIDIIITDDPETVASRLEEDSEIVDILQSFVPDIDTEQGTEEDLEDY